VKRFFLNKCVPGDFAVECTIKNVDSNSANVPEFTKTENINAHETILDLLYDVQAYLKMLLENKVPDSLLVAAWENFYSVYDDLIRRFAVAQGVPHTDVDDCVQDVWIEVTTRLCEFNRPADRPGLRAWLYALVRSKAMNVFRRKVRRPAGSLDQWMMAGQEPRDPRTDPATLMEQQWEQAALESVIEELCEEVSTTNACVLKMRLIDRCSVDEVVCELDLAPEQVHTRQHRMMKKLRARMSLYTGGPIGSSSL
jgi:RNA polymerase sigma factor (sigma-70 family)